MTAELAKHKRMVWIGLGIAILLDSVMQIFWKVFMTRLPASHGFAGTCLMLLGQPLFWVLIGLIVAQFFNWMMVISKSDVSFAQPVTSLSYVVVTVLSIVCLGERFTLLRGVAPGADPGRRLDYRHDPV